MSKLKRFLYGWQRSDAGTYRECFNQFGGSVNVQPDVLDFIAARTGATLDYFHFLQRGRPVAAWPLVNGREVGVCAWRHYPLPYDEVHFPLDPQARVWFPEKSNRLAGALKENLRNVNYRLARKGAACLVTRPLSAKSEKNRRNEFNRFLNAGGECVDQSRFTADELADIYVTLFTAHFSGRVACYDRQRLADFISALRHLVFGHVLLIDGDPCAFDLVLCAQSRQHCYFDVPNGGVDPRYIHLSPGSLVMWQNIRLARQQCAAGGKQMTFSLGGLDADWGYKLRWAQPVTTGKTLF